jgi:hypothetical protein
MDKIISEKWSRNVGRRERQKMRPVPTAWNLRARGPFNRAAYTVGGTVLKYSTTERILGVHDSSDLKWNAHTDIARGN